MLLVVLCLGTMSASSPHFSEVWWFKSEHAWETDCKNSFHFSSCKWHSLKNTIFNLNYVWHLERRTSVVEKKVTVVQVSFCPCYILSKVILVRCLCFPSVQGHMWKKWLNAEIISSALVNVLNEKINIISHLLQNEIFRCASLSSIWIEMSIFLIS